jgi:lipopolysaccharide heptosyltransferase II
MCAWSEATSVLCVRLDALGDVLMTTPALAALKRAAAGRQVTLLASPAGAAVAPLLPMLDETIVYEAPWMKATAPRTTSAADHEFIAQLRQRRFDAAVIFTVYSQNPLPAALLCHLADIPLRLAHCRENPYQLLTHWVPEREPQDLVRHEVQRQLDLVATVGARIDDSRLVLSLRRDVVQQVRQRLQLSGLRLDHPWAVVHAGASAPSRRYPAESFAAVACRLYSDRGCQLVFTGSQGERALVQSIQDAAGVPALSLAGSTDLEELAAVLSLAPLVVSNNTAAVHVAAAVGTPVVDLYALTNPQHGPWQVPHEMLFHEVPCRNCYKSVCPHGHHDCLRLVSPDAVAAAAGRLLNHPIARSRIAPRCLESLAPRRAPCIP